MPNITYNSCDYLFILQPEKFSYLTTSVFFCRVVSLRSEQIVFEVLVFGPAGLDIERGRCTFLSILVFRILFQFFNLLGPVVQSPIKVAPYSFNSMYTRKRVKN